MQTKSTVVKMQGGLPACHCCQEKFLTSLKSQLLGNKNKFTYFQIERCPVSVDLLAEPVISVDVYCTDSRFLICFAFWLDFFFGVPFMFASFVCFQRWEGLLSAFYAFVLISADQIGYFLLSHQCFITALKFTLSTYIKDKLEPFPQKHHVCWRKSHLIQSQISIWTPRWLILSLGVIF